MELFYFLDFVIEFLLKPVNFIVSRLQFVFEIFLRWFAFFRGTSRNSLPRFLEHFIEVSFTTICNDKFRSYDCKLLFRGTKSFDLLIFDNVFLFFPF